MIPAIRQNTIIELLTKHDIIYMNHLSELLGVSLSTLRRDLHELDKNGKVTLLHGGGIQLNKSHTELSMTAKLMLNKDAKTLIAGKASSFAKNNDVIFLDPSSTTLQMIPYLTERNITVITNGIHHIRQITAHQIPGIMIGGTIRHATNSSIGPIAEAALRGLNFNKCFLGANGFSKEAGITNYDTNEYMIKRIAMEQSKETYFLLDSSKYNVVTMIRVASITDAFLITEKKIPELSDLSNLIFV